MNLYIKLLLSIPKIIYTNFKFLPLRQAIRFPIFVSYNTHVSGKGSINLNMVQTGIVRIGFFHVPICNYNDETVVNIDGQLECKGLVRMGNGSKIHIAKEGCLILGSNFHISSSSTLECYHHIEIGDNSLFGWDVLVMDTDGHPLLDENEKVINKNASIRIGDKVWVGSYVRILKGASIPNNTVIGACSVVYGGGKFDPNSVIVGFPAQSRKHIGGWRESYPGFHKL